MCERNILSGKKLHLSSLLRSLKYHAFPTFSNECYFTFRTKGILTIHIKGLIIKNNLSLHFIILYAHYNCFTQYFSILCILCLVYCAVSLATCYRQTHSNQLRMLCRVLCKFACDAVICLKPYEFPLMRFHELRRQFTTS